MYCGSPIVNTQLMVAMVKAHGIPFFCFSTVDLLQIPVVLVTDWSEHMLCFTQSVIRTVKPCNRFSESLSALLGSRFITAIQVAVEILLVSQVYPWFSHGSTS